MRIPSLKSASALAAMALALAYVCLFGNAMSGDYLQLLTPLGFQDESRTYWENPELYFQVSPFSHADQIKTLCFSSTETPTPFHALRLCKASFCFRA